MLGELLAFHNNIIDLPIFIERITNTKSFHALYFFYVGFVMAMTYIVRMNGEFEGASPELFHKLVLGLVLASMVYFIYKKFTFSLSKNSNRKTKDEVVHKK